MLDPLIAMHTLYWLTATLLLVRHFYHRLVVIDDSMFCWHTGAVVRLVEVVFATFVPVRYMIWPPTTGQTEETLTGSRHESSYAGHGYWMRREGTVLGWQDVVEGVVVLAYGWW